MKNLSPAWNKPVQSALRIPVSKFTVSPIRQKRLLNLQRTITKSLNHCHSNQRIIDPIIIGGNYFNGSHDIDHQSQSGVVDGTRRFPFVSVPVSPGADREPVQSNPHTDLCTDVWIYV